LFSPDNLGFKNSNRPKRLFAKRIRRVREVF